MYYVEDGSLRPFLSDPCFNRRCLAERRLDFPPYTSTFSNIKYMLVLQMSAFVNEAQVLMQLVLVKTRTSLVKLKVPNTTRVSRR